MIFSDYQYESTKCMRNLYVSSMLTMESDYDIDKSQW
jgi:hypothetical protein